MLGCPGIHSTHITVGDSPETIVVHVAANDQPYKHSRNARPVVSSEAASKGSSIEGACTVVRKPENKEGTNKCKTRDAIIYAIEMVRND